MKNTFQEFKAASYEEWKALAEKTLKGKPFSSIMSETFEQIQLKPLYTKEDANFETEASLLPEHAGNIAQELWGHSPAEANRVIFEAIQHGQTILHITLDDATLQGKDSDETTKENVLGKGIPFNCVADFESVFSDIALTKYPMMMYTGFTSLPLLSLLSSYVKEKGLSLSDIHGSIGADPLAYLAAEGNLPLPLSNCYDALAGSVKWTRTHAPDVKTIFVKTDVYHNAGANAVQEMAVALATAAEYVRECGKRDVEIDDICNNLTFVFSAGNHLFTEIAKLRAIRILWKKVAHAFGASEDKQKMLLHVRTSNRTKTLYDPYVNMLRATTEAFSAIVGGADSVHVSTFDEAYGAAENNSRRWARNISHILHGEAHLSKVIDPARGSYYVEALTEALAQKAWGLFQAIEKRGGMSKALEEGFIQAEIETIAKKRYEKVTSLKQKIVGTNVYVRQDEVRLKITEPQEQRQRRIRKIQQYKAQRNEKVLQLQQLKEKLIVQDENILNTLIHAASAGATLGEMAGAMISGEGTKVRALTPMRDGQPFEVLREAAEKYAELKGKRPQIIFFHLSEGVKKGKTEQVVTSALEACGFEVVHTFSEVNFIPAEAHAIFMSGENLEMLQSVIQRAGHAKVFVMGSLEEEHEKQLSQQGVSGFVHEAGNLLPLLYELHNELEVIV